MMFSYIHLVCFISNVYKQRSVGQVKFQKNLRNRLVLLEIYQAARHGLLLSSRWKESLFNFISIFKEEWHEKWKIEWSLNILRYSATCIFKNILDNFMPVLVFIWPKSRKKSFLKKPSSRHFKTTSYQCTYEWSKTLSLSQFKFFHMSWGPLPNWCEPLSWFFLKTWLKTSV